MLEPENRWATSVSNDEIWQWTVRRVQDQALRARRWQERMRQVAAETGADVAHDAELAAGMWTLIEEAMVLLEWSIPEAERRDNTV